MNVATATARFNGTRAAPLQFGETVTHVKRGNQGDACSTSRI